MLTVCDFLPVRTVTVRPATLVLKPDGVMLTDEVLHLQRRGAAQRQPYAAWLLLGTAGRRSRLASRSSWPFLRTARQPLDANYPNGPSWTCRPTCRSPNSRQALDELEHQVFEAFEANPARASEAATVIAVFYRQRADPGDVEALVELGDFLYWDELETARPALAIFKRIGAANYKNHREKIRRVA